MNLRSFPLVGDVTRDAAPWIEVVARIGYLVKGVLYLIVSALAVRAALGGGGKADPDSHRAMHSVYAAPFGRVLVGAMAIGLLGYATWRIVEAIADPQRRGTSAKGLALRASSFGSGVIHLGLAFAAASLALVERESGGGNAARDATATVLATPGGFIALWIVAACLFGYGVHQSYRAYRSKLSHDVEYPGEHPIMLNVSRFGIAARGIVFGTIAVLLARAVRDHDAWRAGDLGDSLRTLFHVGRWPYLVIALGLGAYGVYELLNAKYRRIRVANLGLTAPPL